ncbi:MAG: hypothetical protein UT34_C0001G0292 [candidate division WS6 bacterium GW2011_GWF2_39_15]|uniref:Uncharacterized protein n=1 Tax=candidate division WS6 bacterium GW2011_GWF2_39_15 TaxID=1619100 RepID=A0A0G0QXA9_9BACT|nr:MAG: hypothetical protein UT34_C0001G0292 [candidate division WS6 bacterium GW2011_GWF2_39_15]
MFGQMFLEWQFYLFIFCYATCYAIISQILFGELYPLGLVHWILVYLLYASIWQLDKKFTWKKVLKTIFWSTIGNIVITIGFMTLM